MKESEYLDVNYDINAANDFLLRVAHIDPMSSVDIDESGSVADCFGTGIGFLLKVLLTTHLSISWIHWRH